MHQVLLSSLDRSKTVYVACSGGADSVALLHKLWTCKFNVKCLYVSHLWPEEDIIVVELLAKLCRRLSIEFISDTIHSPCRLAGEPKLTEESFRDQRYKVFEKYKDLGIVVTGHQLDDQVETYIMSAMTGNPKFIPFERDGYIYRPLLLKSKEQIYTYCHAWNLEFFSDPNNFNNSNLRSKIRVQLNPVLAELFPNLQETVKNMVRAKLIRNKTCK